MGESLNIGDSLKRITKHHIIPVAMETLPIIFAEL